MHVWLFHLHSAIVTLGTIRPEDSEALFCIAKTKTPKRFGMPRSKSTEPLINVIVKWRKANIAIPLKCTLLPKGIVRVRTVEHISDYRNKDKLGTAKTRNTIHCIYHHFQEYKIRAKQAKNQNVVFKPFSITSHCNLYFYIRDNPDL